MRLLIGTAGWNIPRPLADAFPGEGPHLARYARVFPVTELNSSFQRPHAVETYRKWAELTPPAFRFAVKVPRTITHEGGLRGARQPLERLLAESAGFGDRRGPLLVQLPPGFAFDRRIVRRFFSLLRASTDNAVVCEPRHPSWFTPDVDEVLRLFRVGRAAADPAPCPGADRPGGWDGIVYFRLHGSPRKYWSRYDARFIASLADALRLHASAAETWCIFDNTASGAAAANALELLASLRKSP